MALTVFMDTNLFCWLAGADDLGASVAVRTLNDFAVRLVSCRATLRELQSFQGGAAPERNRQLVERLERLEKPPFQEDGADWRVLLAEEEAGRFKALNGLMTQAEAWGHLADRHLPEGDTARLQEALRRDPTLRALGVFDGDGNGTIDSARGAMGALLRMLGIELPEGDDATVAARLMAMVPEDARRRHAETRRLQHDVLGSDDRVVELACGSAAQLPAVGREQRDVERMALFALHHEEIDFLQVDAAQLSRIAHAKPPHRLREIGLADRCFTMSGLDGLGTALEELETRRFRWTVE